MSVALKKIVSGNKRRYVTNEVNLDLSYISQRIIAMGFPAENLESLYRNSLDDVKRLLDQHHGDKYYVYNLCVEKPYDARKFDGRVAYYPFRDHEPPVFNIIGEFCRDADAWLAKDADNVVVVHCKAGKGRTGVMVCCYLLHSRIQPTLDAVLDFYAEKRTIDHNGVTIPSQKRYIGYYDMLVRDSLQYKPIALVLSSVVISHWPSHAVNASDLQLTFKRLSDSALLYESPVYAINATCCQHLLFQFAAPTVLVGDVKCEVWVKKSSVGRRDKVCHFMFNTFFVELTPQTAHTPPLDECVVAPVKHACFHDSLHADDSQGGKGLGKRRHESATVTSTSQTTPVRLSSVENGILYEGSDCQLTSTTSETVSESFNCRAEIDEMSRPASANLPPLLKFTDESPGSIMRDSVCTSCASDSTRPVCRMADSGHHHNHHHSSAASLSNWTESFRRLGRLLEPGGRKQTPNHLLSMSGPVKSVANNHNGANCTVVNNSTNSVVVITSADNNSSSSSSCSVNLNVLPCHSSFNVESAHDKMPAVAESRRRHVSVPQTALSSSSPSSTAKELSSPPLAPPTNSVDSHDMTALLTEASALCDPGAVVRLRSPSSSPDLGSSCCQPSTRTDRSRACMRKSSAVASSEMVSSCQGGTGEQQLMLHVTKAEIDEVHRQKQFPSTFAMTLSFERLNVDTKCLVTAVAGGGS